MAAGVRAQALARRRLGGRAAADLALTRSLPAALSRLAGTAYDGASRSTDLAEAQQAVVTAYAWNVRVLAGWLPASGTSIPRAVLARVEMSLIEAHLAELLGGPPARPVDLGHLGTAWPRAGTATSWPALRAELAASAWADPGAQPDPENLHRTLEAAWLRRLAVTCPPARGWAQAAAAQLAARVLLLDRAHPDPHLVHHLEEVIGPGWTAATSLAELALRLPSDLRWALQVPDVESLWRAETRLRGQVEHEGMALLRSRLGSPHVVVGALSVLAVDAWRVTAALSDASHGSGPSEVLDAVA